MPLSVAETHVKVHVGTEIADKTDSRESNSKQLQELLYAQSLFITNKAANWKSGNVLEALKSHSGSEAHRGR
jgi:hypothetical protein